MGRVPKTGGPTTKEEDGPLKGEGHSPGMVRAPARQAMSANRRFGVKVRTTVLYANQRAACASTVIRMLRLVTLMSDTRKHMPIVNER